MLHLSKRLQTICSMVEPGSRICDVGCDHAYVDIRLLQEGTVPSALAMDVSDGPLASARMNLEMTELLDRCELRKSDGLAAYEPGEADVMICSGMGGILMRSLLEAQPQKVRSFRELILSPQSEIPLVRDWLSREGYVITEEAFLEDAGKYYTVMRVSAHEAVPVRPDWEEMAATVRGMTDEEMTAAMVDRGQVLKLLCDKGFRQLAENTYGPYVLHQFLLPASEGGAVQRCFAGFLTRQLRGQMEIAGRLSEQADSAAAVHRLREVRAQIGMLQVLLFLYRIR